MKKYLCLIYEEICQLVLSAVSTLLCVCHSSQCIDIIWVRFSLVPYINFFASISEASDPCFMLLPCFLPLLRLCVIDRCYNKIPICYRPFCLATVLTFNLILQPPCSFPGSGLSITRPVSIKTRQTSKHSPPQKNPTPTQNNNKPNPPPCESRFFTMRELTSFVMTWRKGSLIPDGRDHTGAW